jgi:tRNA threonylcarbamoyladenosine biosynthesis protein TsaB
MIVLGIDTCLGACSAAVLEGDRLLAATAEPMWRGHQERLASLVAETMAEAGVAFDELNRVGATVGPGSFTGLRVGVAFAKGLSVALGVPAVGVGALDAFAAGVPGAALVVADARRGQVYWQAFLEGAPATAPAVSPLEDLARQRPAILLGPGAPLAASLFPAAEVRAADAPSPIAVARLIAKAPLAPIKPLYLRPPDAKLPGGVDPFAA